jgi:hypothetical protein
MIFTESKKISQKFSHFLLAIISQLFHHEYFIRIKGKITRKVEEKSSQNDIENKVAKKSIRNLKRRVFSFVC